MLLCNHSEQSEMSVKAPIAWLVQERFGNLDAGRTVRRRKCHYITSQSTSHQNKVPLYSEAYPAFIGIVKTFPKYVCYKTLRLLDYFLCQASDSLRQSRKQLSATLHLELLHFWLIIKFPQLCSLLLRPSPYVIVMHLLLLGRLFQSSFGITVNLY